MPPFHLAIPVDDLFAARAFYGGLLGCPEGRSAGRWIDFDLHGHQLTVHLAEGAGVRATNPVDHDDVPIPHFGVILTFQAWRELANRLRGADAPFLLPPHVRFEGQPGEQGTLFLSDPAGNAIEFKGFADLASVFAR